MRRLLAVAALLFLALPVLARDYTERKEFIHPLAENGRFYLKNEIGEVILRASDRKDVRIVAILKAKDSDESSGPRRVHELRVEVKATPDQVRVRGRWPDRSFFGLFGGKSRLQIDFEIELPRSARLHVENGIGEVRVEGAANDVIVREGIGEVRIDLARSFQPRRVYLRTRIGDVDTHFARRGHMRGWLGKKFTGILDGDRTLDVRVGIGEIRITGGKSAEVL